MTAKLAPSDAIAEIGVSSPGPRVGAFFDLDGTLAPASRRQFMPAIGSGAGRPGLARCWASSRP